MTKTDSSVEAGVRPSRKFLFIGKELCLDFCNTVGGKRGATVREYLNSYADFASWCEQAGLLERPRAEALARTAAGKANTASVLSRAIALREALYRIFSAIGQNKAPQQTDLTLLNSELARTLGRLRIGRTKQAFG